MGFIISLNNRSWLKLIESHFNTKFLSDAKTKMTLPKA